MEKYLKSSHIEAGNFLLGLFPYFHYAMNNNEFEVGSREKLRHKTKRKNRTGKVNPTKNASSQIISRFHQQDPTAKCFLPLPNYITGFKEIVLLVILRHI